MTTLTDKLAAALRALFDCEALEMYRRDDEPQWDAAEVKAARAALAAYDAARKAEEAPLSVDPEPVAQVAEDFVFFLRRRVDGGRWPVGTKLYALADAERAAPACKSGA